MSFARHQTFYIRDGWLRKGIRLVKEKGYNYFNNDEAPEELGIGKNMVEALKFWLRATGLLEKTNSEYSLSEFAQLIERYDEYFEDEGTLWLIHYQLATNYKESTTWYWFFNIFSHKEFDEDTFLYWLENYTKTIGENVALSSLKKDYQCFINTYLNEKKLTKNNSPEDNLNCPLRELELLSNTGIKTFKLNSPSKENLHPLIVFYVMKKWQEDNGEPLQTTIHKLLNSEKNAPKIFNLDYNDLLYYLDQLQGLGYLKVIRTAGLESVNFSNVAAMKVLEEYYKERGEGEDD